MALIWKDPDAVIDVNVDWATNWMASGDTLTNAVWTVPSGITKDSESYTAAGVCTIWLSGGGVDGTLYPLTVRITTNDGRTEDQTIYIRMRTN